MREVRVRGAARLLRGRRRPRRTGRTRRARRAGRARRDHRTRRARRAGRLVGLVVVLLVGTVALWPDDRRAPWDDLADAVRPPVVAAPAELPVTSEALAALAALEVKGRAQHGDYERELFGQAWLDVDRNGCDTRNDVLRRDLDRITLKPGTHGCVVLTGTLDDPYTGTTIDFERGPRSDEVQVDHVVALADAWQKGARGWPEGTRERFANDPLNLLAVDGPANQAKGAADAATWLPPHKAFRCEYASRIVAVKAEYELWVTPAERDALHRLLSACPTA